MARLILINIFKACTSYFDKSDAKEHNRCYA
jgi:hypothetical protein